MIVSPADIWIPFILPDLKYFTVTFELMFTFIASIFPDAVTLLSSSLFPHPDKKNRKIIIK